MGEVPVPVPVAPVKGIAINDTPNKMSMQVQENMQVAPITNRLADDIISGSTKMPQEETERSILSIRPPRYERVESPVSRTNVTQVSSKKKLNLR